MLVGQCLAVSSGTSVFAKEVASARIRIGEEINTLTRAAEIFRFFYTKDKSLVSENC